MAEDTENRKTDNRPQVDQDKGDNGSTLGSDDYLHSSLLDAKDRHLDKAHDYHLDQDMGVSSEQVISNLHLGSHLEKPLPEEDLQNGASPQLPVTDSQEPAPSGETPLPATADEASERAAEPALEERAPRGETATRSGSSSSAPVIDRIDPLDLPSNDAQSDDLSILQSAPATPPTLVSSRNAETGIKSAAEQASPTETNSDLSGVSDVNTDENTVDENAAIGALTGITANSDVADASGVTYSLVDNADGLFAIDPVSGVVTVAGELDAEMVGSHDIVVRALAADGQFSTETFTITVGDVNESGISAVTDVDNAANEIREDAAAGATVGVTARATDEDATATVSYEVDDPRFEIDDAGVVTLAEGASFDADTEGDVSFTVTATSSDGSSSSETFSISVTDLNDETPTDIALSDTSVDENSSGGTVVATLSVSDADLNDTHVYQIADDPSGSFEIVGNEIRVKDGAVLDHEVADAHILTLTVTDAAGQSYSEDVTISVNDVNEAPLSISLDASGTAADFSASDGYTSSSSLADMGLEADTTVVTVSFSTASDIDTAQTLFETGGNYYGLNIVIENGMLNVYAGEGNDIELSTSVEAGTDYNLALELNKETGTLTLLMSDDLPLAEMNADNSLADQQSSWTDQNWDGGNSLGVGNLADHSQGHVGGDFLGEIADEGVSVYADATLESYMKPVVDENSAGGTVVARLSTTDPDAGDTHTYEIADDPSGFFEIVGDEIRIKEGAALDHETSASHEITVEVTDAGGLRHSEVFSIAVQDVNEAPLTLSLDTGNKADFTAADGYTSGTSISDLGLETDNNVFAMSFTTAEDVATAQTLFETGGNVNGLNVVIEKGHLNVYAGNSNNLELSAEISPGTDYNFLLELNKEAGTITLLLSDELAIGEMDQSNSLAAQRSGWPDGDWDGGNNIGVGNMAGHSQGHVGGDFLGKIHDEGLSVYADATLDSFNTGTLTENASGAIVGALSVADPDDGDTHSFTVSDDRFEVLGGTLKLKDNVSLDFENEASVDVTVTAADTAGNTISKTFTVAFDDVAENLVLSDAGVVFTDEGVAETSITGGSGDDTITAHEDGGVIDGGLGDDTLAGNAGDDDLDGGSGADTAVFSGERDDYDITENPDGSFTVADMRDSAPDGTDTVRNVETFRFSDGDILSGDLIVHDITGITDKDATENAFAEDAAAGSIVGVTAIAEDANVSDTVSYSVDDDRFDIDTDGKVTIAEAAGFDAETEGSLDVVVTAVSSDGTSSQQTFTITVTDADEFDVSPVHDVDATENAVSEDAGAGAEIGVTAYAADDDVSDSVSYTVDDDRFEIAEDGTVTVADGATFDAETESSIDVTVTAESTDGSTSSETFTVEVGNVNDNAPTDILITGNPGNLIQNGSFEAFDVSKGSWTHTKTDPSGSWSAEGPIEVWNNLGSVEATEGDKHLELDSDRGVNSISQSVETTLGQVYELSFDAMARSSSETSTVEVYWNDDLVTRFDPETGDWEAIDLQVVGTGGNDVLEFRETDEDNNSYGALLDNVSLTEIPLTIAEGVTGAVVGSVSTIDADTSDKHSYTVSDDRFEIVANGIGVMVLKLRDDESLDRESSDSITLTVTTTDSGGLAHSEDVTVLIADISEFSISSIKDTDAAENTLAEDADAGDKIGVSVAASDADATDSVTYTIDDDRFNIAADGTISVAEGASFDAETEGTVIVTVTAVSSDGSTSSEAFEIEVSDVDEEDVSTITDTDTSENSVAENAVAGTDIGITASATDGDVSDTVSYSVDDNRFDIADDGTVTVADGATFDAETEGSIDVVVTVTSTDGSSSQQTFTITVADVNEFAASSVQDTDATDNTVSEDAAEGTTVGITASASDADASDTVSYTVDDSRFDVADDGTVTVADGASFDAETEGSIDVTVTAESTDGSTSTETFTIDVSDVNETDIAAVVDTDTAANTIAEDAAEGTTVGITASASDADASDTVSYTVDDSRFDVADDGTVTVASGASFDTETEGSIDVTVTAESTDGSTSTETFTIDVSDVNETDISAVVDTDTAANTIAEDAAEGTTVGITAFASDGDVSDTVSYTVDDSRFDVADDGTVTVAAGASFDAETEGSIDVTVTAESTDGSASTETFTIDVSDVNETDISAVVDTDTAANTIAEDAAEGTTVGITAFASDGDVSDTVSYTVDDSRFDVADDGTVTVAAGASFDAETEGSIDVTVTAESTDGSASTETFTIDVSDVNETDISAVVDTDTAANTIAEDAAEGTTVGITASASDADASDTVSYSVDDSRFDVADDGTVTVAAGASFDAETEGSIDVTVTAESTDGSASTETFTIGVSDVNETDISAVVDTDTAANTIAEDAAEGTTVGITASASDADASDTVSYTVDDSRFDVADDGTVTVASGASFDFETEPSISLTITATSSDGTSSEQVVEIDVSDVAETFSLQAGQTEFVDEGVAEPTIYGTDAAETITAHDDGSRIFSGGGADTIHGGKGNDHIEFGTGADTVYGGDGNDFIDDEAGTRPSTEANLLDGGAGNDVIYGGGGDDTLLGGTGNDSLSGEDDDDTLQGDAGNDRISGGAGTDTAVYSGDRNDYDIVENSNGSYTITDTRPDSPDGTDTVNDVEVFRFADGDVLAGDLIAEQVSAVTDTDAADNAITENAAEGDSVGVSVSAEDTNVSDSVSYSVDDARFEVSDDGSVTVAAGAEFDYETEPSIDVVVTATSTDGSTSEETFTISVADAAESMELEDTGVAMTDTGVAESSITGGTGDDTIIAHEDGGDMDGGDGTDTVVGGAGDDTLDGGTGADNDTLEGGEGSDTYMLRGDGRADVISDTGATGTDRLVLAENTGTEFELEDTFNAATQGIEEIDGSGVSGETLRAQRSDSEIDWDFTGVDLDGVDQIEGRDRDDSITGSASDDNILGGAGDDTLAGSEGDDTLDGGTGTDTARFSGNLSDYTVTENAGTVTIVDNRDGSPDGTDTLSNVENFEFADGTYTLGDIVNLAPTDITLSANESLSITEVVGGDAVVTGEIVSDGFGNQSVDHWSISHEGGDLTIDVLAAGYESGNLDSQIYLYRDNGGGDFTLVASNDDGAAGSDGSTRSLDSYVAETGLEAGTYMVVIGSYPLDTGEALDSGSDYPASGSSTGPYQITVTGDAAITGLSENPASGGDWGDPENNAVIVSNGAGEETIAAGSELTGIETVTDENSGDSFHFSFLDDGNGAFQINSDTGSISLAREHDAKTAKSDTVTVQVEDAAGATFNKTVGIELGTSDSDQIIGTDEDDIVFGFSGNDSIDGGAGDDMLVLSGNQADYAIYDNGNNSHTIVDTRSGSPDGTKTVSNVEDFTFADGKVAADELSLSSEITLVDANTSGNQIHEAADAGSEVGISVSALTPGDGALTYALSDDRFSIDADGVVTIADHAFFDSQVESSIDLTVTATAEDGKEASETFTVNVNGSYSYEMTGGLGNGSFTGSDDRSYSVDGIGGNDTIETGNQNDRIEGGSVAGNDQITGNGGRDLLFGQGGDDTISGGDGDDIIVGGSGDDTLRGGDGSDLFMHGLGDGNDVIEGGAGTAWTDVIDLGGGPGVTAAGEYGTDWTVTITNGSVEKTDTENGRLELSKDAEGSIDFSDGSKIDFAQIEEIRW